MYFSFCQPLRSNSEILSIVTGEIINVLFLQCILIYIYSKYFVNFEELCETTLFLKVIIVGLVMLNVNYASFLVLATILI